MRFNIFARFFSFSSIFFLFILLGQSFAFSEDSTNKDLSILRVTPSGDDVPAGREIQIQFNRAVVPVGRMERTPEEVPIKISPALACEWRWLNTSTLSCQLGENDSLVASTKYTLTISPGFKTADGAMLKDGMIHSFITVRPDVRYSWFSTWKSPTHPTATISFNQAVELDSIKQHVFMRDEAGKRVAILAEQTEKSNGERWLVEPAEELAVDSNIQLIAEPGIKSKSGKELSKSEKVIVQFATFPAFKFLGVRCAPTRKGFVDASVVGGDYEEDYSENEESKTVALLVGDPSPQNKKCNPLADVSLLFSSPIEKEGVKDVLTVTPDLRGGRKDYDPWEDVYSYSRTTGSHEKGEIYSLSLPGGLKANSKYRLQAEAGKIIDGFGRTIDTATDFSFSTDNRESKFHLNNQISILEKEVDSHLPIVVTNLDSVSVEYESLTSAGYQASQSSSAPLYPAKNIAYPYPLTVREYLKGKSGVVQGDINARSKTFRAGTWFFSEVTPYHVHAKLGHFNSLVWVSKFSDASPVSGAKVSIYEGSLDDLNAQKHLGVDGTTDKDGLATVSGLSTIDPDLELLNRWQHDQSRLFVKVEKGDEIAILPILNDFDVSYDAMYPYSKQKFGHMQAWGTTAQGVYKLGDTIQYKIFVRDQDLKGLIEAPNGDYKLELRDPTGRTVLERKEIKLSDFSAFDGAIEISKAWPVGWYEFNLSSSFTKETWQPLRVLVSDFTPASYHVSTEVDKKSYLQGETAKVETSAKLHAGGPFSEAQTRVNATLANNTLSFDIPALQGFLFGQGEHIDGKELYEVEDATDANGEYKTSFTINGDSLVYGNITFESSVQDDRGKYVAGSVTTPYFGRDRFIGLKQEDWLLTKNKPAKLELAVVSHAGKIVSGVPVNVKFEYQETKAAKVKGAGNAYTTQYTEEWVPVSECNVTSVEAVSTCDFTPNKAGNFRFVATIKDSKDREHSTTLDRWAFGDDFVLWNTDTGNSLPIDAEQSTYSPGETAKYLVKNPFPGAKALVTMERYGILKSWIVTLKNSTETIEVPVTPDLVPGFYLSVTVMSPRVDKPVENQVDLGKPSFKIGYATTNVKDAVKELVVKVSPEREVYKPRDLVQVDLALTNKESSSKDTEYAVAVLDESVFDLIQAGNDYFDPFKGFYSLGTIDVRNFNIIKQLIGRQKFEKKGANPGGSGGADFDLRSMFKFVAYWNPSVRPDKSGHAKISFNVPDNLTAWRVLTLATTKTDQFGLGYSKFKVNQPTEVRAALPNQIMEGDKFTAKFTVMNRTEHTRTIKVAVSASGSVEGNAQTEQTLTLEQYKRGVVNLDLKSTRFGKIDFEVRASDAEDSDGLKSSLPVLKSAVLETAANYASTTEAKVSDAVSFPANMRGDVGTIGVSLSPTVIGGIDDAFTYIQSYPYACWEQQLTKAVMALHYKQLRAYLPKNLSWPESEKLIAQTLKNAELFQAPNGGMTFYIPHDEYANPYLSAYTALGFNWLKRGGYEIPEKVETALHKYLLEFLRKDDFPSFYSRGLASSVRAVALAALAESKEINLSDIERYQNSVIDMDLFAKSHYLMAATKFPGTEKIQKLVTDAILATSNETGGKFVFGEEYDTLYSRIMASLPRSQCAVLSGLLSVGNNPGGEKLVPTDIYFKVVRAITQYRMPEGHWENTQENVFCMNALTEYSHKFEQTKPNFVANVILDHQKLGEAKMNDFRNEEIKIERDIKADDPGKNTSLDIEKTGPGRLYYSTKLTYALKELRKNSVNAGIDVHREYSVERNKKWELLQSPFKINVGEIVKVDLYVSIPAVRNFVVVDDAVPGGLEPVNKDLATSSQVDAKKGEFEHAKGSFWYGHDDWIPYKFMFWSFYHQEVRHDSVRFYSEYLPAGNYHLSYTAQAIAPGHFTVLPLRTQEMYDTDVYGLSVPAELEVTAIQ